jgi:hypothetical protein
MNHPARHDRVRLIQAVPILGCHAAKSALRGAVWRSCEFVEVEFRKPGESFGVPALVQAEHLEVIEVASPAMHV